MLAGADRTVSFAINSDRMLIHDGRTKEKENVHLEIAEPA